MPKKTHQIGKADERMIVKDLEGAGYQARRQPGSGNVATDLHSDVLWKDSPAGKLHIEAKYRESCQWRNLLKWKAGADILTVRCDARRGDQDGQRYALLSWDLLLRLVGEAAERCSMADLDALDDQDPPQHILDAREVARKLVDFRRDRIQSAHQNPPQKPLTKRKLQGRGFSKGKING